MRFLFLLVIFFILTIGCVLIPEHDSARELLFQTGFNGSSIIEKNSVFDRIIGSDPDLIGKSSWSSIVDGKLIKDAFINYEAGMRTQRYAGIVPDPLDPGNSVIEFTIMEPHIIEDNHMKGRVSAVLRTEGMYKITQSIKLFLHPDMENLTNWDRQVDWFTIFEFWCGDNYRITISLHKDKGTNENVFFEVSCGSKNILGYFTEEWSHKDTGYAVSFGKWMTINLGISLGNIDQGSIKMTVSDDKNKDHPVFNHHRVFGNSKGFTTISPMKLYTSDKLINYMKENNWKLSIYWDDWKFYRN